MPKLNQINALVTGRKSTAEKGLKDCYHDLQKPELFSGMKRTYQPLDAETGEKLPSEEKKVQKRVDGVWADMTKTWTELWDLTYCQDYGNQSAKADVVVDGVAVLKSVPVTTLLFLEKQIVDVITVISKMPIPDNADDWTHDPNQGLLRGRTIETSRSKKVKDVLVKYPATQQHPAQTELIEKDVQAGTWSVTNFSGAMPADVRKAWLERASKFKDALKVAREQANMLDVERVKIGEQVFTWISASK